MLVLSRKVGESIIIGSGEDQVTIILTRISGNRATFGITAPRSMKIIRSEIERYDTKPEEEISDA